MRRSHRQAAPLADFVPISLTAEPMPGPAVDQGQPLRARPLSGDACRASLDRLSPARQGALLAERAERERGRSTAGPDGENWVAM